MDPRFKGKVLDAAVADDTWERLEKAAADNAREQVFIMNHPGFPCVQCFIVSMIKYCHILCLQLPVEGQERGLDDHDEMAEDESDKEEQDVSS